MCKAVRTDLGQSAVMVVNIMDRLGRPITAVAVAIIAVAFRWFPVAQWHLMEINMSTNQGTHPGGLLLDVC